MKANEIYKLDGDVGPASSKTTLVKEVDLGRAGIFLVERKEMISYPPRSYGKVKTSYSIEAYQYTTDDIGTYPEMIKSEYYTKKSEALKAFKQFKV